jgi:hypothetical protein
VRRAVREQRPVVPSRLQSSRAAASRAVWTRHAASAVLTLDTYADLVPDDLELVSAALTRRPGRCR